MYYLEYVLVPIIGVLLCVHRLFHCPILHTFSLLKCSERLVSLFFQRFCLSFQQSTIHSLPSHSLLGRNVFCVLSPERSILIWVINKQTSTSTDSKTLMQWTTFEYISHFAIHHPAVLMKLHNILWQWNPFF